MDWKLWRGMWLLLFLSSGRAFGSQNPSRNIVFHSGPRYGHPDLEYYNYIPDDKPRVGVPLPEASRRDDLNLTSEWGAPRGRYLDMMSSPDKFDTFTVIEKPPRDIWSSGEDPRVLGAFARVPPPPEKSLKRLNSPLVLQKNANLDTLEDTLFMFKKHSSDPLGDKRNFFADKRNSFADKRNTFADERNSFGDKRNNFADERNSFADKRNNFADERNSFADKRNPFADKRTFADERISLTDKRNSFADKRNSFANERNSFADRNLLDEKNVGHEGMNSLSDKMNFFTDKVDVKNQKQNRFPDSNIYPDRFPDRSNTFPDRSNIYPDRLPDRFDADRYYPDGTTTFSDRYPDRTNTFPDRFPDRNNVIPGRYPDRSDEYPSQLFPDGTGTSDRFPNQFDRFPNRFPDRTNTIPGRYPDRSDEYPNQLFPHGTGTSDRFPNQFDRYPNQFPDRTNSFPGRFPDQSGEYPNTLFPHGTGVSDRYPDRSGTFPNTFPDRTNTFPTRFPDRTDRLPTFPDQTVTFPNRFNPNPFEVPRQFGDPVISHSIYVNSNPREVLGIPSFAGEGPIIIRRDHDGASNTPVLVHLGRPAHPIGIPVEQNRGLESGKFGPVFTTIHRAQPTPSIVVPTVSRPILNSGLVPTFHNTFISTPAVIPQTAQRRPVVIQVPASNVNGRLPNERPVVATGRPSIVPDTRFLINFGTNLFNPSPFDSAIDFGVQGPPSNHIENPYRGTEEEKSHLISNQIKDQRNNTSETENPNIRNKERVKNTSARNSRQYGTKSNVSND